MHLPRGVWFLRASDWYPSCSIAFWIVACSENVPSGCSTSKFPSVIEISELPSCCSPEVPRLAVNTKWEAPCGILPPGGIEAIVSCRSLGVRVCRESNQVCHVLPSMSCSSTKRLEIVKARVVERPFSFAQKAVILLNFSRLRESRNITPFFQQFFGHVGKKIAVTRR